MIGGMRSKISAIRGIYCGVRINSFYELRNKIASPAQDRNLPAFLCGLKKRQIDISPISSIAGGRDATVSAIVTWMNRKCCKPSSFKNEILL